MIESPEQLKADLVGLFRTLSEDGQRAVIESIREQVAQRQQGGVA